jgi:3',5'-cyclic AMP phosphodiesterase CpdA
MTNHTSRRGFLECMAWAGTGVLWTVLGGMPKAFALGSGDLPGSAAAATLSFVQISDSHIGFNKEANPDVAGTLREAVAKINALPSPPAFVVHTGDVTHLSKPEEFDIAQQILKSVTTDAMHFVPGEHDVLDGDGAAYFERYGKGTSGAGWSSFDQGGVHFIGLVNVLGLRAGGLGWLGPDQLSWLADDLAGRSASTPIVIFAHMPLWSLYPEWGWGTDDAAVALSYLKRFGSVTVLNGHIHQVMQKVEGSVSFHTAMSTAYPQPKLRTAPAPGPLKVPAGELRGVLGIRDVRYVEGQGALAIIDAPLAGSA